ncbi:MAG: hypothetical protein H6Q19_473 [Bacteroidetes bacterium]|nr:hypothetical protein [Bacteroidota bacterium]
MKTTGILKQLFIRTWKLTADTTAAWDEIAAEKSTVKDVFLQYTIPFILICTIISSLFGFLYADEKRLTIGILKGITIAVSLLAGNLLTYSVSIRTLSKYLPHFAVKENVARLVFYSFSLMYFFRIVTAILPGLFFLKVLNVFTAYLVWDGCRGVMGMDEDERSNFVLLVTGMVIFTPFIARYLLQWLLPNI